MNPPLIGITTNHTQTAQSVRSHTLSEKYTRAISEAGGTPVLIPSGLDMEDMTFLRTRLDGILFSGGADVDPAFFHGEMHPTITDIERERDMLELALVRLAAETNWPFFGICRGIQVINVALGGTLHTHVADFLPNALQHANFEFHPRSYLAHEVNVAEGSRLAEILKTTKIGVNSLHHQGIAELAPKLTATAWSADGLIECVELQDHPFGMGVQWHPEWLPRHEPMRNLFRAFVQACQS